MDEELGWRYYGGKHHESRFTKFFQTYYLPVRFGYDKRLAHLSSMIISGLISRDMALTEMNKPLYDNLEIVADKEYIAKNSIYRPKTLIILFPFQKNHTGITNRMKNGLSLVSKSETI